VAETAVAKKRTQKQPKVAGLGQYRIFRDKLFIGFITISIIVCVGICLALLLRVRPKDFVVPLQYSTLEGFDVLGSWYRVYGFGAFSLVVTFGNIFLAAKAYDKSRLASFLLILGSVMINLFTLIIAITLVSHLDL
jgi:hypothetical protein